MMDAVPVTSAIPTLVAGIGFGGVMMVSHGAVVTTPAGEGVNPMKKQYDILAQEYSNKSAHSPLPKGVEVVYEGNYEGIIFDMTPLYAIQHVGRGDHVAHRRAALEGVPIPGLLSSIAYVGGRGIVNGKEAGAHKGIERDS
jgi:hypothetical protein